MISVVVMISGNGSNLQAIIDKCHGKSVNIEAVYSDEPQAYGLLRALNAGIPAITFEQTEESREKYCEELAESISFFEPKLIILAGFMKILTPNFVDRFKIVNIHPSLLPKYPGLHTHRRVLEAGELQHGITIHMVDHGVDTGPILHQAVTPVYSEDTEESLESRIHRLEHMWYPNIIDDLSFIIGLT